MLVKQYYNKIAISSSSKQNKLSSLKKICEDIIELDSEQCYNIELTNLLSNQEEEILKWIIGSTQHPEYLKYNTFLFEDESSMIVEIGPRLNFSTAFSSNAVSICQNVGLHNITRIELSIRYLIKFNDIITLDKELEEKIVSVLHDKMTQCRYETPLKSFELGIKPEKWYYINVMERGKQALEEVNSKLGLAFDNWDINYYTDLFKNKLGRNPTNVECFDLAQSNSEHSRHWFFKGKMIINGDEEKESLLDLIINTQNYSNQNNVIKFSDNSSAIKGFPITNIKPSDSKTASMFISEEKMQHLIFTAETHNFPTGVAPFSGATTGTGGRLRDVHAVGRGGHYIAGTAGYSFGNLLIPDYDLPWEDKDVKYPRNFAPPLEIAIEASNGASDYGNKFGEPVICGFARSFGLILSTGERREYIKPIMFSGGVGALDSDMVKKLDAEKGMHVVKIGGPVYRIGVGGGSASSVEVQGTNKCELDFGAVQRGDAEMEQKLHRLIRACLEAKEGNPICSIHDQGAGGNGNVLKELVEPSGAVIFTKRFQLGDPTISVLELWGAEYQENDAILCTEQDKATLNKIAHRERCPVNFVGRVTGNGKIILSEEENIDEEAYLNLNTQNDNYPVDLDLELVLGKMPQKEFYLERYPQKLTGLKLPVNLQVRDALERVLRLPSVASKRYLTNKVDRCVTGLVAQQQCVGPLHTPLADVAIVALSHFNIEGIATSIGEQPIKGLINPAAGARLTVGEAITNLAMAKISNLSDVKCSGNWMWPAKLAGEGAALFDTCKAMCQIMNELGIGVDGGKDSLSMAARVNDQTIKAPGTLVVSTYVPCPDIRLVLTPDLKLHETGTLLYVDLSNGMSRLGGTALAQCYKQLGNDVADIVSSQRLIQAFNIIQELIINEKLLSGHDISDGGLITCILEMAFAGNCGVNVNITHKTQSPLEVLFAEELGWIFEVKPEYAADIIQRFNKTNICCYEIGNTDVYGPESLVKIAVNNETVLEDSMCNLFTIWEETSYQLELYQCDKECAKQEFDSLKIRLGPRYKVLFDMSVSLESCTSISCPPKIAVLREEGINGDREMSSAFIMAGFEVWDITMQDLIDETITIDKFKGIIFPGGFSYADVLGSAKGWAANLLFNTKIKLQLDNFYKRNDTFSFGVCNGCQLMSLLGWIGGSNINTQIPSPNITLEKNDSGRFECRFSTVKIQASPAIMLKNMTNSVLGIWIAHGEGKFTFKNENILSKIKSEKCVSMSYVDDESKTTIQYPMNPNGSIEGIAAICSPCGRHLAMMPHPERCIFMWQWPFIPNDWSSKKIKYSPWFRMFQNAFEWSTQQVNH